MFLNSELQWMKTVFNSAFSTLETEMKRKTNLLVQFLLTKTESTILTRPKAQTQQETKAFSNKLA